MASLPSFASRASRIPVSRASVACVGAFALSLICAPYGSAQVRDSSHSISAEFKAAAVAQSARGGQTARADLAWQRARLGAAQVHTLESFAVALGVRLGGSDDGAVFAAANKAIIASKQSGGLAVALPMGVIERTSVGLLLDNNGGYFCPAPGQCTVQDVRTDASSVPTWIVSVNDPYATNLILSGITFYGAWTYGRGPYATSPETDPWLDNQGGVNITHAFSGVDDPHFIANSTVGSQVPAGPH